MYDQLVPSKKTYTQNMTERQKFSTVTKFKEFELRDYEPCVLAQVIMTGDYSSATSGAFRHLFNYISKGNSASKSIVMTAPVIAATETGSNSENWKISFVMPAGSTLKDFPLPLDAKVTMKEKASEYCVAISFRGRANESLALKMETKLREAAMRKGLSLSQEVRICRFDPPFKPGFMQYNEIVIPVSH
jgi:hypothetical protein